MLLIIYVEEFAASECQLETEKENFKNVFGKAPKIENKKNPRK